MRLLFVVASIAAAFAIPVAAARKDVPLHLTHAWHVSLEADGKVSALADKGELASSVRDPLENAIHSWSFEPGRIDGKPAATETTLTLNVTFVPAADGSYAIRIDDARTGGTIDLTKKVKPPNFPRDVAHKARQGFVGRVVVKADYDAEGKIVAVAAQTEQGLHATPSLDAASVAAVQQWTIIPERVGGHGVASSVMVPICYTISTGWPQDFDCDWTPPGSKSKIQDGVAFALAPSAKLATDVIGRTL